MTAQPAVSLSADDIAEILRTVDCEAGVDPGDMAWRDQLTRYSGEPVAAAALCVDGFEGPGQLLMYTGDLNELGVLLARADGTASLPEGHGCDDYYDPQPNLWLGTTSGEAFQPRWPLDECDHLLPPMPNEVFTVDSLTRLPGTP